MGSQLTRENSELGWELIKSLFDHILAMIGNIQSWCKSDGLGVARKNWSHKLYLKNDSTLNKV